MGECMVATSQPLAVASGLHVLREGGNAVDAAVAAALTLTVVECTMNGPGGDAFAQVWHAGKLYGFNGSGKAPAAWSYDVFRTAYTQMPLTGWDTVTVPGAVSLWQALSDTFGTLPFDSLCEQAVGYAREGFAVTPIIAKNWQQAEELFRGNRYAEELFLPKGKPRGRPPSPGEQVFFEDLAATIEEIGATEGESFYRGRLADKIVGYAQQTGGALTGEDLDSHRCTGIEPLSLQYNDVLVHELPPNGQGLIALIALGILSQFDLQQYGVDSPECIHLQIEAVKRAMRDGYRHIADPAFMRAEPGEFLDTQYLQSAAENISMGTASQMKIDSPGTSDTVYLCTGDSDGMMVSFIQSNYMGFGSGLVVPGTGITLHNRGAGFSLEADHPNRVDGGKRPFHTIIPGFVTDTQGDPLLSFGVMGGPMQAQGHLQMIVRSIDFHQNPQAAIDAPRWRVLPGSEVGVEPSMDPSCMQALAEKGHRIRVLPPEEFGGAQIIYKTENGYIGASDPRKDGQAMCF
jgi:gamma-glutamyltranspeptidase/glutathione hydrolase